MRMLFQKGRAAAIILLDRLGIPQPDGGMASSVEDAVEVAAWDRLLEAMLITSMMEFLAWDAVTRHFGRAPGGLELARKFGKR